MAVVNLITLQKSQVRPAAEMLARAFHDDPLFVYFFSEPSGRNRKSTYFFQLLIRYGISYGEAFATSPNLEGVAIWITCDKADMPVWGMIRSGVLQVLLAAGKTGVSRILYYNKHASAVHKRHAPFPHCLLQPLGVDPLFQGKGFASGLLRTQFEKLDQEGLPCYLDTQTEKNVSMYEHYGFKVVEEFQIPSTEFNNWAMLRKPRG